MPYSLHLDFSKIIIPHEKRMSKKLKKKRIKGLRDDFVIVSIYGNQKNALTIVSFEFARCNHHWYKACFSRDW